MAQLQTPSHAHEQFDQLCDPIDEFEYLPTHQNANAEWVAALEVRDDEATIDEQILASLVSPL